MLSLWVTSSELSLELTSRSWSAPVAGWDRILFTTIFTFFSSLHYGPTPPPLTRKNPPSASVDVSSLLRTLVVTLLVSSSTVAVSLAFPVPFVVVVLFSAEESETVTVVFTTEDSEEATVVVFSAGDSAGTVVISAGDSAVTVVF